MTRRVYNETHPRPDGDIFKANRVPAPALASDGPSRRDENPPLPFAYQSNTAEACAIWVKEGDDTTIFSS
ncbi:MAG: hypothetical protein Q7S57_05240 [bacterium]|nr:hypothetical protein [bacterium]